MDEDMDDMILRDCVLSGLAQALFGVQARPSDRWESPGRKLTIQSGVYGHSRCAESERVGLASPLFSVWALQKQACGTVKMWAC